MQMKKAFFIVFFCTLTVLFNGCTGKGSLEDEMLKKESRDSDVSEWLSDGYAFSACVEIAGDEGIFYRARSGGNDPQLMDSTLYYKTISRGQGILESAIYVQERGEKARLLLHFGKEDRKFLYRFAIGEDGCLYLLYGESNTEGEAESYILTKMDTEMRELYSVDIAQSLADTNVYDLKAKTDGGIYGMTEDGTVLFWNKQGELQEKFSLNIDKVDAFNPGGLICTRTAGDYAYFMPQEEDGLTKVLLYNLDIWREKGEAKRNTAQPLIVDLHSHSIAAKNNEQLFMFVDRDGAYLADKNGLWEMELPDGVLKRLFTWEEVNLPAESIQQMERQEDGSFLFYVFDSLGNRNYWYSVEPVPASEKQEKVELVLGVAGIQYDTNSLISLLDRVVLSYNMLHPECSVTIRRYGGADLTDFQLELLKGGGPDILLEPWTYFDMENLLKKNAVVDLAPYLEAAREVTREDILPGILDAITKEEQISRIPLSFSVRVLIIPKEIAKGEMTPKELLALAAKDARYRDIYPLSVWGILAGGEIGRYVDEERKSCSFNSEEFINLLEDMRILEEREWMGSSKLREELFHDRQLLLIQDELSCMLDYLYMRAAFADCGRIAGYPNSSGELRYPLNMYDWLGINNASEHKEEAWNFIEFCLSYTSLADKVSDRFAVIKDTFEEQIHFENIEKLNGAHFYPNNFTDKGIDWTNPVFTTKEETDWLREITEHLYFYENDDLKNIIMEESEAFFAGDISAQEAAKRIQNRAMLVLGE